MKIREVVEDKKERLWRIQGKMLKKVNNWKYLWKIILYIICKKLIKEKMC